MFLTLSRWLSERWTPSYNSQTLHIPSRHPSGLSRPATFNHTARPGRRPATQYNYIVGTHIWRLLAEQRQVRAVLSLLVAEFDAPADRLERDLLDLVVRLAEKGLVTTAGPPA